MNTNLNKDAILRVCHKLNYGYYSSESQEIIEFLNELFASNYIEGKELLANNIFNIHNLPKDTTLKLLDLNSIISTTILRDAKSFSEAELTNFITNYNDVSKLEAISERKDLTKKHIDQLQNKHIQLSSMASRTYDEASEMEEFIDTAAIKNLINTLYFKNQLTSFTIINFLCKGDFLSFSYAISKISEVPETMVKEILETPDSDNFREIYLSANLPEPFFEFCKILLTFKASNKNAHLVSKANFRSSFYNYANNLNMDHIPNIKYLLSLIKG